MRSPLTYSNNVTLESTIPSAWIIEKYRSDLQIDVSRLLDGIDSVEMYRCADTGFRFFEPATAAGDSDFYSRLQEFAWYYMPWKWEHEQAAMYLKPGMKVLEVGCGRGEFLRRIGEGGVLGVGLELNASAIEQGRSLGQDIRAESVEAHAAEHPGAYDVVCSFQVVEHIPDVRTFLEAQIACLRPGGVLIISVPNNDSFLGLGENILNIPPHHFGQWNEQSLRSLTGLFPLRLVRIHLEPLQDYHREYFLHVMSNYLRQEYSIAPSMTRQLLLRAPWLTSRRRRAFTIQAVYMRRGS